MSVNTKMTAIADEIRELSGTTDTMGLDAMASNVNEANIEVNNQANLIAQIADVLEGKAAGGNVSEFSTVTLRLADVNLSDFYVNWGMVDTVKIFGDYINEMYNHAEQQILFDNYNTEVMNQSEISITVPTNSTVFLNFASAANHYISAINSNVHNELYNMADYENIKHLPLSTGSRFSLSKGENHCNIPIFGNTEIIIKEYE